MKHPFQLNDVALEKFDASFLAAWHTNFLPYKINESGTNSYAMLVEAQANSNAELIQELSDRQNCRGTKVTGTNEFSYYSVDVDAAGLEWLATLDSVVRIQLCALLKPVRADSKIRALSCYGDSKILEIPKSDLTNIVAMIDHGCPFAHVGFKGNDKKNLRILSIWDQDTSPEFHNHDGLIPKEFGYGRTVARDVLEKYMALSTSNGIPNEQSCYEQAAYHAMRPRWTHGAAALGLLAANQVSNSLIKTGSDDVPNGNQSVPIEDTDIVFIQLPRGIPLAPVAGATDRSLLDGLAYILASAGTKTKKITTVIDYGSYLGPHDGTSIFEKAIDALVDEATAKNIVFKVVFASGNGYDKGIHARINNQAAEKVNHSIDWWLPPENDCSNFVDIWCAQQNSDFTFTAISPAGEKIEVHHPKNETKTKVHENNAKSMIIIVKSYKNQIQIFMQATATRFDSNLPAPITGRWQFSFTLEQPLEGNIDFYTTWGGRNAGFPLRLKPSRFLKSRIGISTSTEITGDGSLIGSACGVNAIVVGGYENWGNKSQAKYSGAGSSRGGKRASIGNDVLAICEESPSLLGVQCIGTRSAITVRVNGTSVSAPQVGRFLATGRELHTTSTTQPDRRPVTTTAPIPKLVAKKHGEYGEERL